MAFQEFNDIHGGGGGGFVPRRREEEKPPRYGLYLYKAVDLEIVARLLRDQGNLDGYNNTVTRFQSVDFDPLSFRPPTPCDLIGVADLSTGKDLGTYAYGKLIPHHEGLSIIDKLEKKYGVDIPMPPHVGLPYMIQCDNEGSLQPLVPEIAAVITKNPYGRNEYAWSHPVLRRKFRP